MASNILYNASKVLLTCENRVATLTLCDKARMNAMDVTMGTQFLEAINVIKAKEDSIGCILLHGEGESFSAGGDMKFLKDRAVETPANNAKIMRAFYSRFLSIRSVHCPTIAAINGPAVGAGLCVALACDMRTTIRSAKLGVTFAGLGLHPGMGCTHFLPLAVGQQQAARLMYTAELINGDEAEKIGLVMEAIDGNAEACVAKAKNLAERIANKSAPIAVQTTTKSLRMKQDIGLDQALQREADSQAQCYASKDYLAGVMAIIEKNKPQFHGI